LAKRTYPVTLSKSEQLSAIEFRHHSEWSGMCSLVRVLRGLLQTSDIGGDDLLSFGFEE
jgi:hypothetical protein